MNEKHNPHQVLKDLKNYFDSVDLNYTDNNDNNDEKVKVQDDLRKAVKCCESVFDNLEKNEDFYHTRNLHNWKQNLNALNNIKQVYLLLIKRIKISSEDWAGDSKEGQCKEQVLNCLSKLLQAIINPLLKSAKTNLNREKLALNEKQKSHNDKRRIEKEAVLNAWRELIEENITYFSSDRVSHNTYVVNTKNALTNLISVLDNEFKELNDLKAPAIPDSFSSRVKNRFISTIKSPRFQAISGLLVVGFALFITFATGGSATIPFAVAAAAYVFGGLNLIIGIGRNLNQCGIFKTCAPCAKSDDEIKYNRLNSHSFTLQDDTKNLLNSDDFHTGSPGSSRSSYSYNSD